MTIGSPVELFICLLAFAVAANAVLLTRLTKLARSLAPTIGMPTPLSANMPMPAFSGVYLQSEQRVSNESLKGAPGMIVFLAEHCALCQEKSGEIKTTADRAIAQGLSVLVTSMAARRHFKRHLAGGPFVNFAVYIDERLRRRLNPAWFAPLYLFFDENGVVQASNVVGDDDWRSFTAQLETLEPTHVKAIDAA